MTSKSMEQLNHASSGVVSDVAKKSAAKVDDKQKKKENRKSASALPVPSIVATSTTNALSPKKDEARRMQQVQGSPAILKHSILPLLAEVCKNGRNLILLLQYMKNVSLT